jgi:hypothetical protein
MMLGLGGLHNPLIIGQMMGATIRAESQESHYGGLIPTPNIAAAIAGSASIRRSDFSPGTRIEATPFAKAEDCRVFHNFHMRAVYVSHRGRISF